jgi:hypothetical protein
MVCLTWTKGAEAWTTSSSFKDVCEDIGAATLSQSQRTVAECGKQTILYPSSEGRYSASGSPARMSVAPIFAP